MANEYSPELNNQVLQALLRRIQEQQAQQEATARGEASRRGLAGSSFEANRVGAAVRGGQQATADTMLNLAVENAGRIREERLLQESRGFESGESQKNRDFQAGQQKLQNDYNTLETEKQRAFASGETEKAQQFQAKQNEIERQFQEQEAATNRTFGADQAAMQREADAMNARRQGRMDLIGAGANLLGSGLLKGGGGGLFGGGAPAATNTTAMNMARSLGQSGATGVVGGPAGSGGLFGGSGGLLGAGAGLAGGAYAGQSLAKLTGKNTREAKAGSAIGAGLGTALFGPLGGVAGGAIGGLATKGIQVIGKKLFCFDPMTAVEMADGSRKPIKDILLDDEVVEGGKVISVRMALVDEGSRYDYRGIVVTGSHAVKEGGIWLRVGQSLRARPISGDGMVISISTEKHRMVVKGVTFADDLETDDYENLTIDQSLDRLNQMELAGVQ